MQENHELEKLRNKIEKIDEKILEILSRRIAIVKKVGEFKKANKLDFLDLARYQKLLNENIRKAKIFGLDEKFIRKIYDSIHKHSVKIQEKHNL